MRKLRFSGSLYDLSKIMKAVSSRARTSINPMSNGFSTLFSGLLRTLGIFFERRFLQELGGQISPLNCVLQHDPE